MKIARSLGLALALLAVGPIQRSYAQDKTNITAGNGTWNLDTAKSDFGKAAPPRSSRMILAGTSTSRTWAVEDVGADGKSEKESYKGAVDDRFYPIKGSSDGATFAYMKDGSFAVKDKSGKVVETSTWSLSADGRTMTVHSTNHTADGDVTPTYVYQKAK